MRTNIVISDNLMQEAMTLTGITTKREVVDEALKLLVRVSQQDDVLALEGAIDWQGDLDEMRQGRFVPQERILHEERPAYVVNEQQGTDAELDEGSPACP